MVAQEGAVKVLVVRDDKSKSVFRHVVPRKGLDEREFSVDCLVEDIKWGEEERKASHIVDRKI